MNADLAIVTADVVIRGMYDPPRPGLDLAGELLHAVEMLYEVAFTEAKDWRGQEEAVWFARRARRVAVAAMRRASDEKRDLGVLPMVERRRRDEVRALNLLPVKDELRAERRELGERLIAGIQVLMQSEDFDEELLVKRLGGFHLIAQRFVALASQVAEPLPTTDICVCRRCREILLPVGGAYSHCSHIWGNHPGSNFQPLPADFWQKHGPGDRYTRPFQPALDAKGRPEKTVDEIDTALEIAG